MNEENTNQQLAVVQNQPVSMIPVMDLKLAKAKLLELQEFVKEHLVEGEDYGIIPGTQRPCLLKPGADKLKMIYGMADTYKVTQRTEDWSRNLFDYEIECTLLSRGNGGLIGTGLASCNSFEGKYRYRSASRKCPICKAEAICKGKEEFGGGWYCSKNKGGCGKKFAPNSPEIVSQEVGKVENDDIAAIKNTVLKMAKKRALIDAVLSATRSSGLFSPGDDEEFNKVHPAKKASPPRKEDPNQVESPNQSSPRSTQENGDVTPDTVPGIKNHLLNAIEALPASVKASFKVSIMKAKDLDELRDIETLIQDKLPK